MSNQAEAQAPRIGVTMGDPEGIGPEVILASIEALGGALDLVIYGDPALFGGSGAEVEAHERPRDAIEAAARDLASGAIDAVVTGPVSKSCFEGEYPGHTELFADRLGSEDVTMVLTGPRLTVSCVTTHLPLRDVPDALTIAGVLRAARHVAAFLTETRDIAAPRLAVAALNPHASDGGLFGDEEARILAPAVAQLAGEGLDVSGPLSSDTVFHHAAQGRFDAVVCAYHDQALIPFKLLHFSDGVNVTMGLPRPRTSPDHGPAYDIAKQGVADPTSMLRAIELAAQLARSGGDQTPWKHA
jgi:4-hydroxythreonine-4-phosphate dehydrogenase